MAKDAGEYDDEILIFYNKSSIEKPFAKAQFIVLKHAGYYKSFKLFFVYCVYVNISREKKKLY